MRSNVYGMTSDMSKANGRFDARDEWARGPVSLEATPESFADPTTGANDPADHTDPSGTDGGTGGTDAPRSDTADTLVREAMAATDPGGTTADEYVTFGYRGHRPES